MELKASTILIREVFTKSGKGGVAVRKFLGVQTNKEETGQFSPFLVALYNFSKIPFSLSLPFLPFKKLFLVKYIVNPSFVKTGVDS